MAQLSQNVVSGAVAKPTKPVMQSLQVLRAVAALLVVFSHIRQKHLQNSPEAVQFLDWFNFGPYGVDIFFVISGFIIAFIVPVGHFTLTDVKQFIARRFIRVLPLYWVVSMVALAVWMYDPSKVNSSAPHLTRIWESFLLFPTDGRYLYQTGWTLSYEMYFYLLFAATMLLGKFQHIALALVLSGMILAGMVLQPGSDQPGLYLLTRHHLFEFLAGFAFCHLGSHLIGKKPVTGAILSIAAVALILLKAFAAGPLFDSLYHWGIPAVFLVTGMLMLERAVRWPTFLVKLGVASYSLYLTHSFVMAAVAIIWYRLFDPTLVSNIGFFITSLAGSIIVAHLCWRFLENVMTLWLNKNWKRLSTPVNRGEGKRSEIVPAE